MTPHYGCILPVEVLLLPISERYAKDIFHSFTFEVTRYMVPKSPDRIEETLEFIRNSREGMKREDTLQFFERFVNLFNGVLGVDAKSKVTKPFSYWQE